MELFSSLFMMPFISICRTCQTRLPFIFRREQEINHLSIVSFSLLLVLSNMPALRRQREIREGHQLTLGTTFTAVPEGVTDESYAASWSTTAPKYAVSLD